MYYLQLMLTAAAETSRIDDDIEQSWRWSEDHAEVNIHCQMVQISK